MGVAVGWVLPEDKDGDQFAILGNGLRVKVGEVVKEVPLDEKTVMDRIVNAGGQMGGMIGQRRDNSQIFRVPVMLIALARQDLAKVVWSDWEEKNKNYLEQMNQINASEALLSGFFVDRKMEITACYREKDWQHGLEVARAYSLNAEREPKSVYGNVRREPTAQQIVKDLERRVLGDEKAVNLDELAGLEFGVRRAELIRGLDGNVESNAGPMSGMSIDGFVMQEGPEMVPLLLEAVKTDDRLTLGMDYMVNDFGPTLPTTVRSYIGTLLQRMWTGMPTSRLAEFGDPEKAKSAAEWYLLEWSAQSAMRLGKRIHRNVVSGKLSANELDQAMKQLFEKAGPGSQVPYVAGKTPFNIDELTPEEQSEIGEAIEKILAEVSADPNGNHSSAANLVVGLAKIRGKECLPILQRYSRDLVTMIDGDSQNNSLNRYGPAMGAVISQRIALGDRKAAMADLKVVFGKVNLQDSTQIWVLRAAWEFPDDAELQGMVEKLLSGSSAEGPNYVPDFLTSPFADGAWKAPGVRRFALRHLKNEAKLGVAKVERVNGGSASYSYQVAGSGGGSTSGAVSSGVKVGMEVDFSVGDYWAEKVGRSMGIERFSLIDSAAKRKELRGQMIRSLESGSVGKRNARTGVQYIEVWRP